MMMVCGWTPSDVTASPENDHKRQCICQIRHKKMKVVRPVFESCFDNKFCLYVQIITKNENRVDPCLVK